jgi:hypothetical protein
MAVVSVATTLALPKLGTSFTPQSRWLAGGSSTGVVNNTPISHAVELGAERTYVLRTHAPFRLARPRPGQRARRRHPRGPCATRCPAQEPILSDTRERPSSSCSQSRTPPGAADELRHSARLMSEGLVATPTLLPPAAAVGKHLRLVASKTSSGTRASSPTTDQPNHRRRLSGDWRARLRLPRPTPDSSQAEI